MGALDDAIREHLELKRKHGAPDEEILRAEAEALGPARRGPVPAPGDEPDFEPPADPGAEPESVIEPTPPPPPPPPPPPAAEEEEAIVAPYDDRALDQPAAPEPAAPEPSAVEEDPGGSTQAFTPLEAAEAEGEPPLTPEEEDDHLALPEEEPPGFDDPARARTSILDDPLDTRGDLEAEPGPARPAVPYHDEPGPDDPPAPARPPGAPPAPQPPAAAEGEEDVLEETPDFLQETPEHDRLWFEQKPPRDFDFDD
jgi:hypothetical protein